MNKLLLALSALPILTIATSALANPNVAMQQATGYYMSNCGGPTPAHCGGGTTSQKPPSLPLVTVVWAYDNKKQSNMPLFYGANTYEQIDRVGELMMAHGVEHCQKTYGGRCEAAGFIYGNKWVAVASTHSKGEEAPSAAASGNNKATAEQKAIEECKITAADEGYNANDCKVIYASHLRNVKTALPRRKTASIIGDILYP